MDIMLYICKKKKGGTDKFLIGTQQMLQLAIRIL